VLDAKDVRTFQIVLVSEPGTLKRQVDTCLDCGEKIEALMERGIVVPQRGRPATKKRTPRAKARPAEVEPIEGQTTVEDQIAEAEPVTVATVGPLQPSDWPDTPASLETSTIVATPGLRATEDAHLS
jgi:hypothetical protein